MFYKIRANYKSYNMRYFVFLFIMSLTNAITLYKSQFSTHMNSAQNNRFVLTLEYGSLDQYDIQSASAQIFWNSDKLGTITSSSREKEIFSSLVKVVEGKNKLTIKGSDKSLGIIIDNVLLTRQGASDSIVENGNFQTKFPVGQTSTNSFVGWIGSPQIANGKKLNKLWPDSTVAIVGRDIKSSLVQIFIFDRDYRLLTPKYFLSFQYAAQSQSPLSSAIATIMWNDQVFNIGPKDYEVHKFQKEVLVLKNKNNLLKINGQGRADGYGLTIDNVKLIGLGSSLNLVFNGDFQIPHLKDRVQNLNILPGWQSNNKKITVGIGSQFNKKWSKTTGQILTLDNKQNLYIEQRFNFGADYKYIHKEKPYFTVSFNYAAPDEVDLSSSKGELLFDGQVIAQLSPQDKKVHLFEQKISMKPGNNEFSIRPLNKNTILIGNFRIVREGQTEDVAANGNFKQSAYKGLIVGWPGQGQVLDSQQANKLWRDAKVAKITSSKGISQSVELNKDFRIKTNKFVLQFQFVPTSQAPLNVPLGEVSWNGQVFKIIATHYKINIFKVVVIASRGRNLLTLQGQGIQGEGVTIDNVKFTPYGSSALAVNNGDFQDPEIKGIKNYQQFYVITDWQGHNIELGQGEKYSEFWLEKNGQVLSLATAQKTVISKVLSLSEQLSIFDKEPRQFKLSFKYAAEEGKPLAKTGGEIFWNKVLVGDIVPTNYEINSYTIILRARHGINNLFIKGAGGIEAYGLTLDDIELYRQGSKDNLIQNGKFDKAGTPGWTSIINNAPLLNHHWYKNKVGKIDAVQNLTLSKTFQFDSQYIYKTNKFILKFDYALHKDGRVGKAKATCYWNNNKFNLQPRDSKVQRFEIVVFANHGENVLKFQGEGITIDDVRLVPWGSAVSVLLNGGFEDPQFINTEFNGIPSGWKTDSILFSKGYHASTQWPYSASQVITLTKRNNFVSQIVTLAKDNRAIRSQFSFHELQLDFAGIEEEDLEDCKGIVYWNNREIATLAPTGRGTSKLIVKLDVVAGENSLTLKGLDSGILVSNVDLVRYTLSENIIENGKFNQIYYGKDIPYWQGSATIADSQEYNKKWEGAKVAYLKAANSITQKFTFDGNLRLITKKLVLNFEYTVRQGVKFQTAKAKAIWNDQVFDLAPQDYGLHLFNRIVQARPGNNYIIFQSSGVKRLFGTFAEGFTLDNVWVRSYGSSKNLLVNGGFQQPKIEGFDYGMFTNRLPGWITKDIYLGVGYYFSKNWVDTQIVELDGNHEDAKLMQRIKIGPNWQIIQ